MRSRTGRRFAASLAGGAMLLAACGGSDTATEDDTTTEEGTDEGAAAEGGGDDGAGGVEHNGEVAERRGKGVVELSHVSFGSLREAQRRSNPAEMSDGSPRRFATRDDNQDGMG